MSGTSGATPGSVLGGGATAGLPNTTAVMDLSVGGALDAQLTQLWVLICAYLVFFMQCGFAMLETGTVRMKNTKNILLKNVIDACVATFAWWSVGYAFAYGECGQNPFIGHANFFTSQASNQNGLFWTNWVFGWAFSSTAATVVSGAVAERAQFKAYIIYTSWISAFVYPVVVHWVWSDAGWLSARRQTDCALASASPTLATYDPYFTKANGLMDFAGSGVVHMVGGGAALMGATFLGPRLGRFSAKGELVEFSNSSPTSMAVGTFILWLGWYGFNSGSTQCFYNCMPVAAQIAVNTTLAATAGGLTCLALAMLLGYPGDIGPLLNGILAGAVSITAGCAMVQAYAAVLIGVIGGGVYYGASKLLLLLRIDDPLDASPVHFFCGMWGLLAVGFFATETSTQQAYGYARDWGVFYGGRGYQLGVQLLGLVCIAAWTCSLNGLLFWGLKKMHWLRVPAEVEKQGLDIAQGLGSGVLGGCFGRNTYTGAMQRHLGREGARKPEWGAEEDGAV